MPDHDYPWFPFYVKDFASDGKVEAMSTTAVGAYILLLCKAWRENPAGTLPTDDLVLARWARLTSDAWAEVRSSVMSAFTECEGRWHQKRMRAEYLKLVNKTKLAKSSANKRWKCERIANALPTHYEGNARASDSDSESSSGKESAERKPKPRDPIWDCVVGVWFPGDITPLTTRIGKLVRDFKGYNASPDEIHRRLGNYRKRWPDMTATPEALVKHWHEFASGNGKAAETPASRRAKLDRELTEAEAAHATARVTRIKGEIAALEAKQEIPA